MSCHHKGKILTVFCLPFEFVAALNLTDGSDFSTDLITSGWQNKTWLISKAINKVGDLFLFSVNINAQHGVNKEDRNHSGFEGTWRNSKDNKITKRTEHYRGVPHESNLGPLLFHICTYWFPDKPLSWSSSLKNCYYYCCFQEKLLSLYHKRYFLEIRIREIADSASNLSLW
jgi:hypothetical protein